ncbi:NB-ARC domain-containing protein [Saccharothrix sp. Mg75]|uniref:NB-ARC domain-containing protein n=1 Tax=Saccharothrix sp. Mg75 TaxID=3445357 RepID=UPI003EE8E14D
MHGSAVQAGSIDMLNLHNPSAGAAAVVPWQLPPGMRVFTDRERDRERLSLLLPTVTDADAAVGVGPVMVGLHGPAGIGKTALAVRWLSELRDRFPDGLLYARFDAGGPAHVPNPDSVLTGFLLALGVAQHALPAEPEHRIALYRTLTSGRALAVLLDDVGEVGQVMPLVPSGPRCLLMVTGRRPLVRLIEQGAWPHQVAALSREHGLALFQGITGHDRVHADLQAAAALVGLCGGRPLSIALLAANAALHPGVPLAVLAADLAGDPVDSRAREDNVVERAVTADYEGLEPLGQVLFRLLGVQPVSRFTFPMLLALLAPSHEQPSSVQDVEAADEQRSDLTSRSRSRRAARVHRVLDGLVAAHLLTHHPATNLPGTDSAQDPAGTTGPVWEIDAVPHHLARRLAETLDPKKVRLAALVRVVDLVLWPALHAADLLVTPHRRRTPYPATAEDDMSGEAVAFSDRAGALAWLERTVDTVAAYAHALHTAGGHRRAWHLVDALWPLWQHRKDYTLRLELDVLALRAAHAWDDEAAQAEMLTRIGLAQTSLRAFDEAAEALTAALALRLRLRDRWGEADCRTTLGLYHQALGNVDHAGDQFRLSARQYQAIGALREQALTNHHLGVLYLDAGQPHLAQVQLSRTLDEFAALPEPDERNALRTRVDLARAHLGIGQHDRARALIVAAVDGLARLADAVEHARALEVLADIAHATGDPSYPHRLADALTVYESVNSPCAGRVRERLAATGAPATAEPDGDRTVEDPESRRP